MHCGIEAQRAAVGLLVCSISYCLRNPDDADSNINLEESPLLALHGKPKNTNEARLPLPTFTRLKPQPLERIESAALI